MLIQNVNNAQAASPLSGTTHAAPSADQAAVVAAVNKALETQPAGNQPNKAQLQEAVDNINNSLLRGNTNLHFSIDQDSHKPVVKVIDSKSGDVIKQFPSKEAIAIAQSIDNIHKGLLLKQQG